jgi:hypothetical protein
MLPIDYYSPVAAIAICSGVATAAASYSRKTAEIQAKRRSNFCAIFPKLMLINNNWRRSFAYTTPP